MIKLIPWVGDIITGYQEGLIKSQESLKEEEGGRRGSGIESDVTQEVTVV